VKPADSTSLDYLLLVCSDRLCICRKAFLELEGAKDVLGALLENAKEAVREMEEAEDAAAQTNGQASSLTLARTGPEHFGIS